MIYLLPTIVAISIVIWLLSKRKKKGGNVSGHGIETYDSYNNITFSTDNKLFRYIGYKDLALGSFNISVNVSNGQPVFIPIVLSTNNQELSHQVAIAVDMPYISEARISGNTFSGVVKSPADFRYDGSLRNKPLIRVFYGVY